MDSSIVRTTYDRDLYAPAAMSLPRLPIFESIARHASKRALTDARLDRTVTYAQLLSRALALRANLLGQVGKANLEDVRVALLCPPGLNWSVAQLAVWAAGGAMTPLADRHPLSEMQHAVKTAAVSILIAHESFAARASELAEASGIEHVVTVTDADAEGDAAIPPFADVDFEQPAMILLCVVVAARCADSPAPQGARASPKPLFTRTALWPRKPTRWRSAGASRPRTTSTRSCQ